MPQLRYTGVFRHVKVDGDRTHRVLEKDTRSYCVVLTCGEDLIAAEELVGKLGAHIERLPASNAKHQLSCTTHGVYGLVFLNGHIVMDASSPQLRHVLEAINARASQIRRLRKLNPPKETMLQAYVPPVVFDPVEQMERFHFAERFGLPFEHLQLFGSARVWIALLG